MPPKKIFVVSFSLLLVGQIILLLKTVWGIHLTIGWFWDLIPDVALVLGYNLLIAAGITTGVWIKRKI